MNKLAVIIPFYKRLELTKLCFKRLNSQSKRLKFDVIVAGSEGQKSKDLAKGLKYIEVENQPLGRKLNALIEECRGYDGVILMGSDDFMSDSIIEMYQKVDVSVPVYYVFDDVYVYSAKFKEVRSGLDYNSRPSGCGIGRMYTKTALELLDYNIWENNRMKGLDGDAHRKCHSKGVTPEWVKLDKHFLIDAKVEENITSHHAVLLRDKKHPLSIITDELGQIGKDILALELGKEFIYKSSQVNAKQVEIKKVKCEVLIDFNEYKKGDIISLKTTIVNALSKGGYISRVN